MIFFIYEINLIFFYLGNFIRKMNLRFVGYTRISTDHQSENSFEAQKYAIEQYIKSKNAVLLDVLRDTFTGEENERPVLMKAVQLCRDLNANIIVSKMDRFSRNTAFIIGFEEKYQISVKFLNLPEFVDKHLMYMFAIFSQMERESISDRTKEALASKRRAGTYNPTGENLKNVPRNTKAGKEKWIKKSFTHRQNILKELERIDHEYCLTEQNSIRNRENLENVPTDQQNVSCAKSENVPTDQQNIEIKHIPIEVAVEQLNKRYNYTIQNKAWTEKSLIWLIEEAREKKELENYKFEIISKSENKRIEKEKEKKKKESEKEKRENAIQPNETTLTPISVDIGSLEFVELPLN